MVPKISWFARCALALIALHLTACPEQPPPPPPPEDTSPPSTRANPLGGTYTSAQTVTLTCDDGSGSGCEGTYYTTDGSNPTASSTRYSNPISLRATTTLKFFSVDQAGNQESIRTETYTLNIPPTDTQAPTTTAAPAGGTYNAAQTVTLTCTDGASGCANTYYTTNGSNPTTSSTRYTAPIAIAASTTLKFFSLDQAGNQEAVRTETYVIDTQAPTTTATPAGGTYNSARNVTLTCNDSAGTGCAGTYYTTDGSNPTTSSTRYTAAIAIAANATLKFFSVDNAGNSEAVRTATYVIDAQAPTTVAAPLGGNYNAAQSITLTCNDGAGTGCAGTYYTTDGTSPTNRSTPYTVPIPLFVTTTLKFFSVDTAGNAEPVRTENYVFDTAAPTTTAAPAGGSYGAAQSVTLTCADGTGTGCDNTYYTVDGSDPTTSSTRYTTAIDIAANTTLKFFSVDNVGNSEAVRTQTYVIDTTAPTTTATPAGGTYDEAQTVRLECGDGTGSSGCTNTYYTTNGSDPTTSSPRYSAPISIEGNTTLKFFSVDRVGNQEQIRTETYVINAPDTRAPTTTATPAGGSYNTAQSVTLSCTDGVGGSGCANTYYTVDGSDPTTGSARYTTPIAIATNTTLKFFSVDNAGNPEQIRTATYVIDSQAPTTTASPVGGTYSTARSVTLTCSDEAGGSSCDATYYTTDGSDPTTSSPRYTDPITLSANTTLKFFSVDRAGNQEQVRTESYVIDTQAPTTTATPAAGAYSAAQTVTLTCNDGTGGTGCANTYYTVDGSDPTTSSPRYTDPIAIGATTTLKFFSVDRVGNQEQIRTAAYVIDAQAPTTTASPTGGRYEADQTVTLTCTDGSGDSSSGCNGTYYTTDGSNPTTGSTRYTDPISLRFATTLKFFSVDRAGNQEPVNTVVYNIFVGANISGQIAAVRAAANGAINLPITGALVTYVRPLIGGDPAGFFLQAERNGPAIFVAVDPATLTPAPAVGDRVAFTATQRATQDSQARITALSGYSRLTQGESVEALRVEISSVDFSQAAALNDLESELISMSGTINSNFGGAGTDHLQATLTTFGTTTGTNLRLRVPTTLLDQLDLANGCNVGVNSPLWRFATTAQPSIWKPSDLAIAVCPAPKVISAVATASNAVTVRFDRRLNPTSVLPDGSQFTFTNGLVATAATVVDREVRVTTNAQSGGASYQVTVADTVLDTYGTPLDSSARSATFNGYRAPATLRITEVAPGISNARDLVELVAVQGGSVNAFTVVQGASTILATLPDVLVTTGDVIVIHLNPTAANGDAPSAETTAKNQFPASAHNANYDNAWDFHGNGSAEVGYSQRVLRVRTPLGNIQDGVSFARTGSNPTDFLTQLQALQSEGHWLPVNCGGVACTYATTPTAVQVSADWANCGNNRTGDTVRRISATDTNTKDDWAVGANSLGAANP